MIDTQIIMVIALVDSQTITVDALKVSHKLVQHFLIFVLHLQIIHMPCYRHLTPVHHLVCNSGIILAQLESISLQVLHKLEVEGEGTP
jgi:hypothetical protein